MCVLATGINNYCRSGRLASDKVVDERTQSIFGNRSDLIPFASDQNSNPPLRYNIVKNTVNIPGRICPSLENGVLVVHRVLLELRSDSIKILFKSIRANLPVQHNSLRTNLIARLGFKHLSGYFLHSELTPKYP